MQRINSPAIETEGNSICPQHDAVHFITCPYRSRCLLSRRSRKYQKFRHGGQARPCGQLTISDFFIMFLLTRSTTNQNFVGFTDGNTTSFLGIPFAKPP